MNRQVKFRAFQDNEMIYSKGIGVYASKNFLHKCYEDCELMQFTGLYDINGQEVYEGDIIKSPRVEPGYYSSGIVEFNVETCCYILRRKDNTFVRLDVRKDTLEVIGNVHQNPELLK